MAANNFINLKILSLNVNGIRNIAKRKAIFLFCRRSNADIFFLRETHSCKDDRKFWKSQRGDQLYLSHASNDSAGVAILFNKFKGDILETHSSEEGRWIILVLKVNNIILIVNNNYGHNNNALAKHMFVQLTVNLIKLKEKYKEAHLIIGGDLNDTADDLMDRLPARMPSSSRFNVISYLSEHLNVIDAWHYIHPYQKELESNASGSLQSRIDVLLISSYAMQYVSDITHTYAPFSDHKMIVISFINPLEKKATLRGYWKLNCNLLKNEAFCNSVKALAGNIFNGKELSNIQKWEFFKFKIRESAIRHSKEMKKRSNLEETGIMKELNILVNKVSLTLEEETKLIKLKDDLDKLYTNMTKGAFIRSRAKWLEEGEKNTSYFFALEKRNYKKNNITSLKIDNSVTSNPIELANHTFQFYSDLYSSKYNSIKSEEFINNVKRFTPQISNKFKLDCEKMISKAEILEAVHKMKKGKSPGIDGYRLNFTSTFGI